MEAKVRMGKKQKRMTKLIILEGIDGSGKTTIAKEICKNRANTLFLSKKTIEGNTEFQRKFMKLIRTPLWESKSDSIHDIDEESWLYLHLLWYHMVEVFVLDHYMKSELDYIIMDGWFYKFLARHIVNDKMNPQVALSLFSRVISGDHIIVLDVPANVCYERIGTPSPSECGIHKHSLKVYNEFDCFCKYQNEVFEALKSLEKYYGFKYIDANKPISEVTENILMLI